MNDRCEPPEEWRGRDGWHWLRHENSGMTDVHHWLRATNEWSASGQSKLFTPGFLFAKSWRYVAPCLPPAPFEKRVEAALAVWANSHLDKTMHHHGYTSPEMKTEWAVRMAAALRAADAVGAAP